MKYTDDNWEKIAPRMLHYQYSIPEGKHAEIANLAKQHYWKGKSLKSDPQSIRALTHLAGDDQITSSTIRAVQLQAKINRSPVRMYYYSYRAAQSLSDYLSHSTVDMGKMNKDYQFIA